jgi:hypothetical protein
MPAFQVWNSSKQDQPAVIQYLMLTVKNPQHSFGTLQDLHTIVRRKHPHMLMRNVIVLHDNICPHVACTVQDTLCSMRWKVLDHPLYGPDLSLCDFHVFSPLRKVLKGRRLETDEDVKATVVPTAAHGVLYGLDQSAGASVGRLSQLPWGIFFMASTPSST